MKKNFSKLPLRKGVGVVLLNNKNKFFVAKRIDNPKNFWQMPQGGIDEGENYYEAALRELKEETSVVSVELIQEIEEKSVKVKGRNLLNLLYNWLEEIVTITISEGFAIGNFTVNIKKKYIKI